MTMAIETIEKLLILLPFDTQCLSAVLNLLHALLHSLIFHLVVVLVVHLESSFCIVSQIDRVIVVLIVRHVSR